MTAINAKSEALELHELSSEELDAVSGGWGPSVENREQLVENREQLKALQAFAQVLKTAGSV